MKLTGKDLEDYIKLNVPKPKIIGDYEVTEEDRKLVDEYIKEYTNKKHSNK